MNKRLRNSLFAVTAAVSSFLLLSGFDSAMTVPDIMSNSQGYMSAAPGMACDVEGVADVSLDMTMGGQTQSIPLTGNASMNVQYTLEPFSLAVTGSAQGDASAMGVSGEVSIDLYMITQDDGSGVMYVYLPAAGDDSWHAAAITAEDVSMMKTMVTSALSGDAAAATAQLGVDLSAVQDSFYSNLTLSPEPVMVNNIECYEVTGTITGDAFAQMLSQVSEVAPQAINESAMMVLQMVLGGIQIDTKMYYATENFAPVQASVDLSSSDFSAIGQMFLAMSMASASTDSSQTPDMSISVNALNLTANFAELDSAIEVPADALAAPVETTVSLSDAMNMASSAAANAEEAIQ